MTRPIATNAYVRYLPTKFKRNVSRPSGKTTSSKSAIARNPSTSRRLSGVFATLPEMVSRRCFSVFIQLPPHLDGEQPLRPHHQNHDHERQREHLRHRSGHEELRGRLSLRDAERRRDRSE